MTDILLNHYDTSPFLERFRRMKTLQKFAAVHGTVHNHFSQERHLISKDFYRERRSAALADWREVMG